MAPVFSGASLTKSATQSIGTVSEAAVTFDGEEYDTDNYHDNASNTSRLTIPTTGYYRLNGSIRVASLADQKQIQLYFRADGTTGLPGANQIRSSGGSTLEASHTCLAYLTAGQYVEMMAFNGDSVSRSVGVSPNTCFQIQKEASGPAGPTGATGPAGGWELVVDESGASAANWTSVAGTWSADAGGYLKQTDTTAAYRGLKYNTIVPPGAGLVAQAEIRFPSAATTGRRAMLGLACAGIVATTRDPWAGIGENTDNVILQVGDQATDSVAMTIDEDVWYTVRVTLLNGVMSVSVDGVYKRASRVAAVASSITEADIFMLVNFTGEVHYRNIKVWRLTGPT